MNRLDGLSAALALEVDALCDDFERHWRGAGRLGLAPPSVEVFVMRASEPARPTLRTCLEQLERDLQIGVSLPALPGLSLVEEIGRGGMGVVYRARTSGGRAVAVKLIPAAEHDRWSRWLTECGDLTHPNLVPLEAFGTHDGLHFVVMPLVSGGDLKERQPEFQVGPGGGRAETARVARLMAKVAAAVDFLHTRGLLHRDLKPSNILLAAPTDPEPLVCDFGLAGRLDEAATEFSGAVGTLRYMAPEQRKGGPLTPAADVWGLGVILRELLAGEGSDTPLGEVCRRCLDVDPARRYPTAGQMADDLRRYLNHGPDP